MAFTNKNFLHSDVCFVCAETEFYPVFLNFRVYWDFYAEQGVLKLVKRRETFWFANLA